MAETVWVGTGEENRRAGVRNLRLFAGWAVSLGLLACVLWRVDAAGAWQAFRRLSPEAILSSLFILWLSLPVRVRQWQHLLGDPREASFRRTFDALCLGYAGNCVLPMRGGELVRAWALARSTGLPLGGIIPSLVMTRVQDLLPMAALPALMLWAVPWDDTLLSRAQVGGTAGVLAGAAAFGLIGTMALLFFSHPILRGAVWLSAKIVPRSPKYVEALAEQVDAATAQVRITRRFWTGQGLALGCWTLYVTAPVPLLLACGLKGPEAARAALAVATFTTVGHLLPSAPAAVGTYHAFCLAALKVAAPGLAPADAVAYAFVSHLIGTLGPALPAVTALRNGLAKRAREG